MKKLSIISTISIMKKLSIMSIMFATLLLQTNCSSDFLNTAPSDAVDRDALKAGYGSGRALLVGVNRDRFMSDGNTHQFSFGERSATLILDYMGDDQYCLPSTASYGGDWSQNRNLHCEMNNAVLTAQPWNKFYRLINTLNQLLNVIPEMVGVSEVQSNYLKAQGLAYRAHFYHMLVRTYAQAVHHSPNDLGIVLFTEEDIPVTGLPQGKARATVKQTYDKIEADLLEAERLLALPGVNALATDITFIRLNVVRGLLSRVYLDLHNFAKAAQYANAARTAIPLMSKTQFGDGFFTTNAEWMWASFVPADEANSYATFPAEMVNGAAANMYPAAWGFSNCINTQLISATDAANDCRIAGLLGDGTARTNAYCKYRAGLARPYDIVYMRGAEMLLNEAEALCMPGTQQNAAAAKVLLRTLVVNRINEAWAVANVDPLTTPEDILAGVKLQRRLEFWGEGIRFFDLKRRGEVLDRRTNGSTQSTILTPYITNPKSKFWVYLIPEREVRVNPIVEQNKYTSY